MGDRNTTAGQTNKAGPSDGTLTPDKVFVAVPTTDSKAQTSIAMDGFELGRRSSTQRFTQCSESGAPPQEQSCDDRLLEKRPFGLFTAQACDWCSGLLHYCGTKLSLLEEESHHARSGWNASRAQQSGRHSVTCRLFFFGARRQLGRGRKLRR